MRASRPTQSGCGANERSFGTAQENFDSFYGIPSDQRIPYGLSRSAIPGPKHLFDFPVYFRGAMTLHRLRLAVGDGDFFRDPAAVGSAEPGGNGTTGEFIQLPEEVSGKDLGDLFDTWLFTPGKPGPGAMSSHRAGAAVDMRDAPLAAQSLMQRLKAGSKAGRY